MDCGFPMLIGQDKPTIDPSLLEEHKEDYHSENGNDISEDPNYYEACQTGAAEKPSNVGAVCCK